MGDSSAQSLDDKQYREKLAAAISSDFKIKSCKAFVGSTSAQGKGPAVICFNMEDIPLKAEGFGDRKQVIAGLPVIRTEREGFARVPQFEKGGKYQLGSNPLPLSERGPWTADGVSPDMASKLGELTCYPYEIVPGRPKNKNKRNEDCMWKVYPGMVLRNSFWADISRGGNEGMKKMREELTAAGYDCIPAFSLLEVELVCKGWSPWKEGDKDPLNPEMPVDVSPVARGYGMGVNSIKILQGASLHSILDLLPVIFPSTLDACKARQQEWQSKFQSIRDVIQIERVPFFVKVANRSTMVDIDDNPALADDPKGKQIKLTNWCPDAASQPEAGHPVDILYEHALAATNSTDIKAACALLELAANAGALSLLVCCNLYRPGKTMARSVLYGYPLVDTTVLLRSIQVPINAEGLCVDETENYFAFRTDFQVAFPAASGGDDDEDDDDGDEPKEEMLAPLLLISKEPFTNVKGEKGAKQIKTPDFMLVGPNQPLSRAYYARFVHPRLEHKCVLWSGYVNMSKPQITGSGLAYNILHAAAAAAAALSSGGAGGSGGGVGGAVVASGARKRSRWASVQEQANAFDPFATATAAVGASKKGVKASSTASDDDSDSMASAPAVASAAGADSDDNMPDDDNMAASGGRKSGGKKLVDKKKKGRN